MNISSGWKNSLTGSNAPKLIATSGNLSLSLYSTPVTSHFRENCFPVYQANNLKSTLQNCNQSTENRHLLERKYVQGISAYPHDVYFQSPTLTKHFISSLNQQASVSIEQPNHNKLTLF